MAITDVRGQLGAHPDSQHCPSAGPAVTMLVRRCASAVWTRVAPADHLLDNTMGSLPTGHLTLFGLPICRYAGRSPVTLTRYLIKLGYVMSAQQIHQCLPNVGSTSTTFDQHWASIGHSIVFAANMKTSEDEIRAYLRQHQPLPSPLWPHATSKYTTHVAIHSATWPDVTKKVVLFKEKVMNVFQHDLVSVRENSRAEWLTFDIALYTLDENNPDPG